MILLCLESQTVIGLGSGSKPEAKVLALMNVRVQTAETSVGVYDTDEVEGKTNNFYSSSSVSYIHISFLYCNPNQACPHSWLPDSCIGSPLQPNFNTPTLWRSSIQIGSSVYQEWFANLYSIHASDSIEVSACWAPLFLSLTLLFWLPISHWVLESEDISGYAIFSAAWAYSVGSWANSASCLQSLASQSTFTISVKVMPECKLKLDWWCWWWPVLVGICWQWLVLDGVVWQWLEFKWTFGFSFDVVLTIDMVLYLELNRGRQSR